MDATQDLSMPSPLASDSNDVQVALTTAQSLWSQDPREALRWLRKAAEGASDAGDDLRSVQLARAAADLRNQSGVTATLPPGAVSNSATANSAAANSAAVNPGAGNGEGNAAVSGVASQAAASSAAEAVLATPLGFAHNPGQTVPATPAAAAAAALHQAAIAAQAMQPSATAEQQAPHHQQAAEQQAAYAAQQAAAQQAAIAQQAALAQQAAIAQQAAQQAAAQQASLAAQQAAAAQQAQSAAQLAQTAKNPTVTTQRMTAPGVAPSQPGAASNGWAEPSSPISVAPTSAPFFVSHRTVRVALSPAPNGHGEFSVHPLAEGEATPEGWKDALLVALDPSERLFPGRG
jgi:hypothetical protein